ncbi:MAG: substrate-binding domain-containing protein [Acidimicrobiales bacterium]
MRRVLAVVGAAAMVAGSLALRSRLDRRSAERSQVLRLTCASELEAACARLATGDSRVKVTVEPAGVTADRLATTTTVDSGLDGWLAPAAWPDLVDQERQSHALPALFAGPRPTVARSPLVLAVWKDRAAALAPRCGPGGLGWTCLGEAAGTPGGWQAVAGHPEWGDVKPGHTSPASTAVGLLVVGQAVAAWFGRAAVSTADLEDDGFQRWFGGLERAVPAPAASPLQTMLVTGPATFDAAATTEAEAAPLLATSARRDSVDLLYPAPMATADVVLATGPGGGAASSLRDVAAGRPGRAALAAAGWRVDGEPLAAGVPDRPALPTAAGLPPAGLLDALRSQWHGVTGR